MKLFVCQRNIESASFGAWHGTAEAVVATMAVVAVAVTVAVAVKQPTARAVQL